jgi:hypothetical protein
LGTVAPEVKRAYYGAPITDFIKADPDAILGQLAIGHSLDLEVTQKTAWLFQIQHLQNVLARHDQRNSPEEHVFFEFQIPRIGRRADVILLIQGTVFVLEYKVGSDSYDRTSINQVTDYALDLKNFHKASHDLAIVPVLVVTGALETQAQLTRAPDGVFNVVLATPTNLADLLLRALHQIPFARVDASEWATSPYQPTPTIVEAAQALYSNHSVRDISRSDADAVNLTETTEAVTEIIERTHRESGKSICFITGVPGAGKTLAGLNIATERARLEIGSRAVFLSGNDPLVRVLQEALARNRYRNSHLNETKGESYRKVAAFIQHFRHFRDDTYVSAAPPQERVVIFDEAQRAWQKEQLESFMRRKRRVANFPFSEPQYLLHVMDRHRDWACIICLVGGGQEINTGEAGIGEWIQAVEKDFPHWRVHYSSLMRGREYDWDGSLDTRLQTIGAISRPDLHLSVSLRSFRANNLADFVSAVVEGDAHQARVIFGRLKEYPIFLTRRIESAKEWLRKKARGTERFGLLASSGALRLRPDGVAVKIQIEPENWFLNSAADVRSSFYLEDVATEFDIQGLELDWSVVCWDPNFRFIDGQWSTYSFVGTKWQKVQKSERQRYIANSYRVLLTRARQGLVVFVPKGDEGDPTRNPVWYESTFQFLRSCGVPELPQ